MSVFIGIGTYRQASPNFDSRDSIKAVKILLNSTKAGSITEIKAIGRGLSAYNRKVANSRLLTHYRGQDLSKLTDPELILLREYYSDTAIKPFAVREYGVIAAVTVGIFSTGLTVTTTWLIIWFVAYQISLRRKGAKVLIEIVSRG
jgi:hypothetical protein